MIPIVCVDDGWGMAFGGRRQSRDREVSARVLADAAGRPLWCAPSSLALFGPGAEGHLTAAEDFLNRAGPGELCFVEGRPLLPWLERMEGLVLYRWNRRYPPMCTWTYGRSRRGGGWSAGRSFPAVLTPALPRRSTNDETSPASAVPVRPAPHRL